MAALGAGVWSTRDLGCRQISDPSGITQSCSISPLRTSLKGIGSHRTMVPHSFTLGMKMKLSRRSSVAKTVHCDQKSEPRVLETWSMEETYDALASRLMEATRTTDLSGKYIIGMAGPPGAGKTTVAMEVVARLNKLWKKERSVGSEVMDIAVVVPMDGFHLYRWQLDNMEDPSEAHARRGGPYLSLNTL